MFLLQVCLQFSVWISMYRTLICGANITGASRGIGFGLVKAILQNHLHYRVVATCRTPESAEELLSLAGTFKDRLLVLPLDTTKKEAHVEVLTRLAELSITAIDLLIANAGIASSAQNDDPPLLSTIEDMLHVYNTNVVGSMLTLQAYNDLVTAADRGAVVMVSSILGSITNTAGVGKRTAYRTSKAALNMLAMAYSEETSFRSAGGKVICLHPGNS
jgi:NAD(P)-dependent dehydrogenase (short-subunit alcohol dehydrogenase family)